MYLIFAAVILLASLALIVQVSLPYSKTGRGSVLYSFILVFLRGFLRSKHIIENKCNFQKVQRLKVAILPLYLPCSGFVTHSGEILTTGKSHRKKLDRIKILQNWTSEKLVFVNGCPYTHIFSVSNGVLIVQQNPLPHLELLLATKCRFQVYLDFQINILYSFLFYLINATRAYSTCCNLFLRTVLDWSINGLNSYICISSFHCTIHPLLRPMYLLITLVSNSCNIKIKGINKFRFQRILNIYSYILFKLLYT